MSFSEKTIKLKNFEKELFYREYGEGQPVLMLHGNPGNGLDFDAVAEEFVKNGFRCIVPDRPGHAKNLSLPNFVNDKNTAIATYNELIDTLCEGRAYIVGYSLGSYYALKIATLYPKKINGIGVITPLIFSKDTDKASQIPKIAKLPVIDKILKKIFPMLAGKKLKDHFEKVYIPQVLDEEKKKKLMDEFCSLESIVSVTIDKNEFIEAPIESAKLKKLEIPCAAIGAKLDAVVNSTGEADKLKLIMRDNAYNESINDAGHAAIFTHAQQISKIIINFWKKFEETKKSENMTEEAKNA